MNTKALTPALSASSKRRLQSGNGRYKGLLVCSLLLALIGLASLFTGVRPIPAASVWQALISFDVSNTEHLLVQHLRIPRMWLGIITGCALGVSGAMMQALTRNPLADPGILGVNAGAMVAIVSAIAFLGITEVSGYMWFGLAGAALAGIGVYLLGGFKRGINPVRIVLAGSALSVVLLALTHLITVNSHDTVFDQFRHWAVGSLQGRGYDVLLPVSALVFLGLGLSLSLTRALDTVSLGQDLGRTLGSDPNRVWLLAALAITLLAGAATAAAGPISFVGLTAPHLARFIAGPDHRWLLPYSMVLSAILVVAADSLGCLLGAPGEISVGIMVALIGGPFFIILVRRWKIVQL